MTSWAPSRSGSLRGVLLAGAVALACRPASTDDPAEGEGARPPDRDAFDVDPEFEVEAPVERSEPEPAPPAPPFFGHADRDPDNDQQVGPPEPLVDCETRLRAAGVVFKAARIGLGRKRNGVHTCGAAQVVRYVRGPAEIRWRNGDGSKASAPLLTCTMALALVDFEKVVQEVADAELGGKVVQIDHLGTYNCREMALYDLVSEHSFANAIDLRRFHVEGGGTVGVLEHFQPALPDAEVDAKARFLRRLSRRLFDEDVFSNVLNPWFDHVHRNHIHADLARYRVEVTPQ